ncbi:mechanosensitive ion channel protein MscS [Bacillus coahuilensis m2-6]|uniref:Mechanosensitive ion channel protein MscS n=1 Tax=Bacillus coahuilensis p1.1.43 TaxID=1150625 RepID=A0A147KCS5_9BACI|nr:mechanosensitive ion channel protein MscS [Bacillus coahuilensis p1.1.43]KUP10017.1 mechanosensitive ion channel protein MscS [Bacillus coahuilensis m2-6]
MEETVEQTETSLEDTKEAVEKTVDKLFDQETWLNIGETTLQILLILLISSVVIRVGKSALRKIFTVRSKQPIKISERRQMTILKLLENILTYVVYFIVIITILGTLNINVAGLLAGAGIVGLAVGFGAQNLVRDVITGFFIIFEDQFSVGDYVRIGTSEGFVEEIGLRTTKIKSWTGELHIIPNGNIAEVTNLSIHNSIAVIDISIAYEEDIQKAEEVIQAFLKGLPERYEDIVSEPQLLGVQTLGASDVVYRITAETKPMQHIGISRAIRKDLKIELDKHNIEIPFPRLVMYSKADEAKVESQKG